MRNRILILSALLLCWMGAMAQNGKDYRPLVDSLVRANFYASLDIAESVKNIGKSYKDTDPLRIEYGVVHSKKMMDFLNRVVERTSEVVKNEEDYRVLQEYYQRTKRMNDIMTSTDFQRAFTRRMVAKLVGALIDYVKHNGYGTLEMGKYEILDKEFESAFNVFWNSGNKGVYEAIFQALGEELAKSQSGNEQIAVDFMKSLQDALPNYLCLTLMEYCTAEELVAYSNNGQIADMQKQLTGELTAFLQKVLENIDEWEQEIISLARSATSLELAEYAYKTQREERTPVKKHVRTATIPWKKGTYTGEVFNTLPHGKGIYTDKKGVTYDGDWVEGCRQGYITMTKPGKEPEKKLWAGDKKLKGKAQIKDGFNGMFYNDKPFGPGTKYENNGNTIKKGFFVDGELHGKGYMRTSNYECAGLFEYGKFVSGTAKIEYTNSTVELKGNFDISDFSGRGVMKITNTKSVSVREGRFVDGQQFGLGESVTVWNTGDTVAYNGTFAYGKRAGKGRFMQNANAKRAEITYDGLIYDTDFPSGNIHRRTNNARDAWNYDYVGEYYNERYHGKGVVKMIKDQDTITYCGNFKNGVFDGYGEYASSIFVFKGNFKHGLIHGEGVATNKQGLVLEGDWKYGKPYGKCKVTDKDGNVWEGLYYEGTVTGVRKNKKGVITSRNSSVEFEYYYRNLTK